MEEKEEVTVEPCYICLEIEGIDIKPCVTICCTAVAHRKCLDEQINTSQLCGKCRQPLAKKTLSKKVNHEKCIETYTTTVVAVLLWIGGPIITILMIFGKSLFHGENEMVIGFATLGIIPFMLFYLQSQCCCSYYFDDSSWPVFFCCSDTRACRYDLTEWDFEAYVIDRPCDYRKRTYMTIGFMVLLSNFVILITHCIGYFIILGLFNFYVFFTAKTFLAGFVFYLILATVGLIAFLSKKLYGWCVRIHMESFTEEEVIYGTVIADK